MTFNTVVSGTTITATWGNQVRDQQVSVFASVAARDSAVTVPVSGMYATTTDTGWLWRYSGSKWLRQLDLITRTTDVSYTSQATLQDDAVLQFPVDINSTYWFDATVLWIGAATPGYQWALRWPAGSRIDYARHSIVGSTITWDAAVNQASGTAFNSSSTASGNTGSNRMTGILVTGGTSGSLVYQAAQAASNVTAVSTQRGSSISHRQMA